MEQKVQQECKDVNSQPTLNHLKGEPAMFSKTSMLVSPQSWRERSIQSTWVYPLFNDAGFKPIKASGLDATQRAVSKVPAAG